MSASWDSAHAVCDEALRITQTDRNAANGNAEDNFAFIAMTWTALLRARGLLEDSQELNAADVARLMLGLKLCRDANAPHRDNRVDTIGYALCLERVESTEPTLPKSCATCRHNGGLFCTVGRPDCHSLNRWEPQLSRRAANRAAYDDLVR